MSDLADPGPHRLAEVRRLFTYESWANRQTLAALAIGSPPSSALSRMAHVVGAGRLWLGRLLGEPPAVVWPALDLEGCRAGWEELERRWSRYLVDLDAAGLERSVSYVNSLGEAWTSTVDDILTQVVLHGAYHRGQIAADLRAADAEPAYTDFIEAVRRGHLD